MACVIQERENHLCVTWRFRCDIHAEIYATNMTRVKKVLSLFQRRFYTSENQLRVRNTFNEFPDTFPRRFLCPFLPAFSMPRFRHCLRRGGFLHLATLSQTIDYQFPAFSFLHRALRCSCSFLLPLFVLSAIGFPTATMHISDNTMDFTQKTLTPDQRSTRAVFRNGSRRVTIRYAVLYLSTRRMFRLGFFFDIHDRLTGYESMLNFSKGSLGADFIYFT